MPGLDPHPLDANPQAHEDANPQGAHFLHMLRAIPGLEDHLSDTMDDHNRAAGLPDAVESALNELGIVMKRHGMKATSLFADMKQEAGSDMVPRDVFIEQLEEVSR